MSNLVVTAQIPEYLPGLAYFDRINQSGACIFLNSVKLKRRDNCARTKILGQSKPELLTIALKRSGKKGQLIKDAVIDENNIWKKKHLKKLYHVYRNAPYFEESYPVLEDILKRDWILIADLNRILIESICSMLQIKCEFHLSSELFGEIKNAGQLVDLLQTVEGYSLLAEEADRPFLSAGGRSPSCGNETLFTSKGLKLSFHKFYHPVYNQQRESFIPGLSIVDALFHCGNLAVNSLLNQPQRYKK